jgi:hypothetical protein
MTVYSMEQVVFRRRSVRNYNLKRALSDDIADLIATMVDGFQPGISGASVGAELIPASDAVEVYAKPNRVQAPYYLALLAQDTPHALVDVGRLGGIIALTLASRGLGTCFLGMMHPRSSSTFNLPYAITLAFGYQRDDIILHDEPNQSDRLPLGAVLIAPDDDLTNAQEAIALVNAGRTAPSAMNKQPWRIAPEDGLVSIWRKKPPILLRSTMGHLQQIDGGLCMASIEAEALVLKHHPSALRLSEDQRGTQVENCLYEGTVLLEPDSIEKLVARRNAEAQTGEDGQDSTHEDHS